MAKNKLVIDLNETIHSWYKAEKSMVAARFAIAAIFFLNGLLFSSWVAHIPWVKAKFGLDDGELGLLLLCISLGALFSLPITGLIIGKTGSTRILRSISWIYVALLPFLLIIPNVWLLALALTVFGAVNGAMDISMNAQAAVIEKAYAKPIMSSFHAMWSLGTLFGSGFASLLLHLGIGHVQHVTGVAVIIFMVMIIATLNLLPAHIDIDHKDSRNRQKRGKKNLSAKLLLLGIFALVVMMGEGSTADWSAVLLKYELGADDSQAIMGFLAFAFLMAFSRLIGDKITAAFGGVWIIRAGAVISALGMAIAALSPYTGSLTLGIIGFGLVGLGVANMVPVIFSAAGKQTPQSPGRGMAAASSIGYAGFLIGPPLLGFIAEASSRSFSLGLVAFSFLVIASGAQIVES